MHSVSTHSADAAEQFYEGALARIRRLMIVLAILTAAFLWLRFGAPVALGFATGCAIAFLNFFWLKRSITAFTLRASGQPSPLSADGTVFRFLLRYFLMGIVAYAIFRFLPASLYGLLAGLFLPVGGIVCEAGYEVFVALRRGY